MDINHLLGLGRGRFAQAGVFANDLIEVVHRIEIDVVHVSGARFDVARYRQIPQLVDDEIVLPVRRVQAGGVTVPFAHRRLGTHRLTIPPLAHDLHVTGIEVTADRLTAWGRIAHMREPIWLDQIIRAASTVGSQVVLNLRPPSTRTEQA